MATLLVDKEAYINCLDQVDVYLTLLERNLTAIKLGKSPLHVAAGRSDLSVAAFLIFMKANVDAKDAVSIRPLALGLNCFNKLT